MAVCRRSNSLSDDLNKMTKIRMVSTDHIIHQTYQNKTGKFELCFFLNIQLHKYAIKTTIWSMITSNVIVPNQSIDSLGSYFTP